MDENSSSREIAVGLNRSLKLIRAKKAKKIYLANNADSYFVEKVMNAVNGVTVEIDESYSAEQLAEKYGIEVPSAIVTIY